MNISQPKYDKTNPVLSMFIGRICGKPKVFFLGHRAGVSMLSFLQCFVAVDV